MARSIFALGLLWLALAWLGLSLFLDRPDHIVNSRKKNRLRHLDMKRYQSKWNSFNPVLL